MHFAALHLRIKSIDPSNYSKFEKFLVQKVQLGFDEIVDARQLVFDAPLQISHLPDNLEALTISRHIRYHMHAYLNFVYILKCRLLDYSKGILRSFKDTEHHDNFQEVDRILRELIESALGEITKKRGHFVHVSNSSLSNPKTLWLSMFDLFRPHLVKTNPAKVSEFESKTANDWKLNLTNINNYIEIVIEEYSELILNSLFDEDDQILLPTKYS